MAAARIRIWDLPVRLFHWAIVLLVPALWWTAENGRLDLHMTLGKVMLGLVLFRLAWGLLGSSTARFAGFVRGPAGVLRYLSGRAAAGPGHNPLGGWSVVLMLFVLAVQIGLGLLASDEDALNAGPLSHLVSYETAVVLAQWHETLFFVLLGLIVLHLLAILFYLLVKRRDLVTPMITGRGPAGPDDAAMVPAPPWRFVLAAAIGAGGAWTIVTQL